MARKKSGHEVKHLLAILVALSIVCPTGFALAGQHTWDVNEVFSNADGTIQFVELWEANGGTGEVNVGLNPLSAKSPTKSFTIAACACRCTSDERVGGWNLPKRG